MNIWLLRTSEPMPVVDKDERTLRMGMIAEELSKRGHNVTWFASTFNHFTKQQSFDKDTIVKVKENYYLNLSHAPAYKKNISLERILNHKVIANKFRKKAKNLKKPDLIYVAYPIIEYAEEAVKYGKKNNIPVIVDIRDLWPDIFNHNLPKWMRLLASPYIKLMAHKAKKIMKNAYAINSISDAMLNWGLEKGNRTKNKMDRYFYIGYNKPTNIDVLEEYKEIDKSKFNISFLATINNQFDYEKIAQLARNLEEKDKNIIINICGDGPQMNELKEQIKGLNNIKLHGWLGKDELSYILKNSQIGLAPYKNTFDFQMSVSNKFAEYIAYNLPIALTSGGYMKSLLEEYNCGISTPDMDRMCDYIVELKNDRKKYDLISNNAKKLYEENFQAKKIYKDLVDYLEEIVGGKKNEIRTNRVWEDSTQSLRSSIK